MRSAKVLYKEEEAGIITQHDNGSFTFSYHAAWLNDDSKPAISLTFPKEQKVYDSAYLFPFFFSMLPEGSNKNVICSTDRIDRDDHFGLLLATAKYDTIGAVSVIEITAA